MTHRHTKHFREKLWSAKQFGRSCWRFTVFLLKALWWELLIYASLECFPVSCTFNRQDDKKITLKTTICNPFKTRSLWPCLHSISFPLIVTLLRFERKNMHTLKKYIYVWLLSYDLKLILAICLQWYLHLLTSSTACTVTWLIHACIMQSQVNSVRSKSTLTSTHLVNYLSGQISE